MVFPVSRSPASKVGLVYNRFSVCRGDKKALLSLENLGDRDLIDLFSDIHPPFAMLNVFFRLIFNQAFAGGNRNQGGESLEQKACVVKKPEGRGKALPRTKTPSGGQVGALSGGINSGDPSPPSRTLKTLMLAHL